MHVERGVRRAGAYFVDLLLLTLVGVAAGYSTSEMDSRDLGLPMSAVSCAYLLLKDIAGASVGKIVFGLRVRSGHGNANQVAARVLRNIPLALGPAMASVVPAGGFAGDVVRAIGGLVVLIEVGFVFQDGRRLGDRLAGTIVTNRSAARQGNFGAFITSLAFGAVHVALTYSNFAQVPARS